MPQRDDLIEEIKRTDLLLEWAVQHIRPRRRRRVARRSAATEPRSGHKRPSDEAEAERLREMLRAIREEVDALYIEGTRYRKTGIVFFGLEKPGTAHQTDLFDATPPAEQSRLYAAVNALNARYGKGKVFSARLSRGPLRPLRGSRYALSQPDRLRRQAHHARRVRFPTGREPPQGAVTPRASAHGRGT